MLQRNRFLAYKNGGACGGVGMGVRVSGWGCVCGRVCSGEGHPAPGVEWGWGALRAGSTAILLSGSLILGCFSSLSFQFI